MSPPATNEMDEDGAPPIKRRQGSGLNQNLDALPASWLVDFEGSISAETVDRLVEDRRLYQVLSRQNFEGPGWERFQNALARYGLQVLRSWIHKGLIFRRCHERGLPTKKPVPLEREQVDELAATTVAEAIHAFRARVLRRNAWDPGRGASLRTYFIGQCLLQFPRIYERWLRTEQEWALVDRPDNLDVVEMSPGPAAVAETRLLLSAALAAPRALQLARVLHMIDSGYGQVEVARRLGMSVGSVESLLYRHRRKVGA